MHVTRVCLVVAVCLQEYPKPDEVEYYYDDKHDPALKSRVIDDDYSENYEEEQRKQQNQTGQQQQQQQQPEAASSPLGAVMPELRDYTLNDEYRDPFKSLPSVSIRQLTDRFYRATLC